MEKDYFDAKFDGLEKMMASQEKNLTGYIGAVSANVKEVRADLQTHKESTDAHGAGAASRQGGNVIQWIGLLISVIAAVGVFAPMLRK